MEANVQRMQEKYAAHLDHAHHVTRLALRLFDDLRELTGLHSVEDRRVLELAANLHDIGHFVHSKKHHQHSCHLIRSDRLLEEWPPELRLWVSVVALNHRKKKLRLDDLSPKYHDRARSLVALLRMADAFDYEHDQRVQIERIDVDAAGPQVHLHLRGLPPEEHRDRLQGKFQLACLSWDTQITLHNTNNLNRPHSKE